MVGGLRTRPPNMFYFTPRTRIRSFCLFGSVRVGAVHEAEGVLDESCDALVRPLASCFDKFFGPLTSLLGGKGATKLSF